MTLHAVIIWAYRTYLIVVQSIILQYPIVLNATYKTP